MPNPSALLAIQTLSMADLRSKYEEVLGEPTSSRDRSFLLSRVIPALREQTADEAPQTSVSSRARVPRPKSGAGRDERLPPPGSVLTREFDGKTYSVTVLEEGFEFDGQTWASLTRIACEITGTPWNGYLFFHLSKYPKRSSQQRGA